MAAAQKVENGLNRTRASVGQGSNPVLANSLALSSPSTQYMLDEILAADGNFGALTTFRPRVPWDHVTLNHFRAAASQRLNDPLSAYTHQRTAYDAFLRMLIDLPRWLTGTLYVLSKDLILISRQADERLVSEGRRPTLVEEATRSVNQGFSLCLTDREPQLAESRKWGTYRMANLLFALYLRQHAYKLCTSMIRAIRTAELPPLEHFAIADHLTFRYYRGMLAFRAENYAAARDDFAFALRHCHRDARRNKTLILMYLVPLMMAEGRMPDERALRAYPRVWALYGDFVRAAVAGNVGLFDRLMQEREHDLAAVGTVLAVEHVRKVAMRQLFYKVYLIDGRPSRIAFERFRTGLAVAGLSLETIHVEALLADMVHAGYIKGYLAHDHGLVVLSKQDPFPSFATLAAAAAASPNAGAVTTPAPSSRN
ncbi:COP9 signalosome (CSN) subunit [Coemansia erecta]|uniref:COP9 signalosome (CSN) subunit n=1 Tax=Coemansia erecta TaxID=147472 RepID=A0A9W7XQU5_9FUNG|nr:COP9 signalosome (CSN) subunit [Coemansia erecta]